jgi:hypothetical protein
MRERLDRIQDATAKPYDANTEISVCISFREGEDRVRFRWPIERDAAEKLYAELGSALKATR